MARSNRLWVVLIAVLGAAAIVGYGLRLKDVREAAPDAPEPLIVTIDYGTIENTIPAPGTLQPSEVVPVVTPSTGELASLHVALGDFVEAGQLLATIDPDLQRDESEIRAPIAGNITSIDQRLGAYLIVSETAPTVMVISNLATLTMTSEVFEADISAVDDAVGVYFSTLASRLTRWYGDRIRIHPTPVIRNGAATYPVLFDVDNAEGDFFPGMTTQVFFVTLSVENVLTVPIGALTLADATGDTRRATVEAVRPDGKTERREIVVRAMDRVNAEVVSGLAAGDRVVAGTLLPPIVVTELEGDSGRGRPRRDDRFFEPGRDSR
jgi:multidrug efflux pump subunit AcrA (membrane-fusion protein)